MARSMPTEDVPANFGTAEHVTTKVGATEDVPANISTANYGATAKGGRISADTSAYGEVQGEGEYRQEFGRGCFGPPTSKDQGEEYRQELGCGRFGPPTSEDKNSEQRQRRKHGGKSSTPPTCRNDWQE